MNAILYTFPISHFSEKARWALDLAAFPYTENKCIPGEHVQILKPLVKDTYVPVLQTSDSIIQGSSEILSFVEEKAFGRKAKEEEIIAEKSIDESIGKSLQTILYFFILDQPKLVGKLFLPTPSSKKEEGIAPPHYEMISLFLKRRYRITEKNVTLVKQVFETKCQELDRIYANQKSYLGGNFGRVDLTVASLLACLAEPTECPATPWFQSVTMPEAFDEWKKNLRLETLWEKVRDFYREFRIQSK